MNSKVRRHVAYGSDANRQGVTRAVIHGLSTLILMLLMAVPVRGQGLIYWPDRGPLKIFRVDPNKNDPKYMFPIGESFVNVGATSVAVDPIAGKVYWVQFESNGFGTIKRANAAGASQIEMVVGSNQAPHPEDIALDLSAGRLYWIDSVDNVIRSSTLDGQDIEDVVTSGIDESRALALDLREGGKIYWSHQTRQLIQRADLNGRNPETVVSGFTGIVESIGIDTINNRLYWTENVPAAGWVRSADLSGLNVDVKTIVTIENPARELRGVTVDLRAGDVYWAKRGGSDAAIQRARVDVVGQTPTDVVAYYDINSLPFRLQQPFDVAFDDPGLLCGNGAVEAGAGEECDDANFVARDGCDPDCQSECGNGTREGSEECDDGDRNSGDGCSGTCAEETGWICPPAGACSPDCGDLLVRPGETCDDGNETSGDGCSATCLAETGWSCPTTGGVGGSCKPICGNGPPAQTPLEECDDGNLIDGDGCDSNCTVTRCGNGIATAGEECDPPALGECSTTCEVLPYCGNGNRDLGVCRRTSHVSCTDDAACDSTPGAGDGRCDAGKCIEDGSLIGMTCVQDSDCGSGAECYSESCDDGLECDGGTNDGGVCRSDAECPNGGRCLPDNTDDCINDQGICALSRCGDKFVYDGTEECDPPNGANCNSECKRDRSASCRRRLGGLTFLDSTPGRRRLRSTRICRDGDATCDEDLTRDGRCTFAINVCLAIPSGENTPREPKEIRSIDFIGLDVGGYSEALLPINLWHREVANALVTKLDDLPDAQAPDRCVAGLTDKACSTDNQCDSFLGRGDGRCGPATGVEFSRPLAFDPAQPSCVSAAIVVPEAARLKLRTRVRGECTNDTSVVMPRDGDRLLMICRPGTGPTVTPTP